MYNPKSPLLKKEESPHYYKQSQISLSVHILRGSKFFLSVVLNRKGVCGIVPIWDLRESKFTF